MPGLLIISFHSYAQKNNPVHIIAMEPVTMMDLGIMRLNAGLRSTKQRSLRGATINARYNTGRGTIDIKVSMPVKKASRAQCKKLVDSAKKIILKPFGKKAVSTIHHYFQHEGIAYKNRISWKDLEKHVVITGLALTRKNYQESVYCQSRLMEQKVTY